MKCPLSVYAKEHPEHIALRETEKDWSAKELNQWVAGTAVKLQRQGIKPQDRVSFLGLINSQSIILIFSLLRIGAIACPLNFRNPQLNLERLEAVHIDLETFIWEKGDSGEEEINEESIAFLLFTSGSTAIPKIAALTFGNFYYNALGALEVLSLTHKDTWHLSLPLFHVGGLSILFRCFMAQACVVIAEKRGNVSFTSMVPTQLYRVLKENKPLQNTTILMGGAPLSRELFFQAIEKGLRVWPSYGMTEMGSLITLNSGKTLLDQVGYNSGYPLTYRDVCIDEEGEILVKGKTLFKGYWDKEKGLTLPLNKGGWFKTNDLGYWNAQGSLCFQARKDNLFISGGENIQPEEIEQLICELCQVEMAVVVPVEDKEFGCIPVVFIKGDQNIESLKRALSSVFPKYKIPKAVFPLPHTESLKISRKELIQLAKFHLKELKAPQE